MKSLRSTTNSLILIQKMKFPQLKLKSLKDLESLRTIKMKSPGKQKNRDGKASPNAQGEQQKKKMSEVMQQQLQMMQRQVNRKSFPGPPVPALTEWWRNTQLDWTSRSRRKGKGRKRTP